MNERIRELAEQAKPLDRDGQRVRGLNSEYHDQWMDKFAELIVRECVDICYDHPARIPSNNWQGIQVPHDVAARIKAHFGVGE